MKQSFFLLALYLFLPQLLDAQKAKVEHTLFSAEIYFDFGRHELRPEADSVLKTVAANFQKYSNALVQITAHTDSIGTGKNNQALSERRAETASYALVEQGIPSTSIRVATYGEGKPGAANRTEEGRQRNRRVTLAIVIPLSMTKLEGKVTDPKSGEGLEADVVVRSKDFLDSTRSNTEGYWHVNVPEGVVVGVDVFAEGYFFESEMLKVLPGKPILVQTEMKRAEKGEKAEIKNLYYVGDQAVLLENSKPELPKVLRFVQLNPSLNIEIAGHVNYPNRPPTGKESWEFKLSEARAKMVYDYLLENGIPKSRVSWKGYGNWEMVLPKATLESDQAKNRRVEIRVLAGN